MFSWPGDLQKAREIQTQMARDVVREDSFGAIKRIAGTDVGFENQGSLTRAAVVVLSYPDLTVLEYELVREPTRIPYIPGYLSFRECPAILAALQQLSEPPDMLMCDGQGIAHPRRLGVAAHLGVLTGIPAIGVAKSRLIGHFDEPDRQKGSWSPLYDGDDCIGAVVRTRRGVKPLFISIGHKVSLTTAIDIVLQCTTRYRLPETTRWADRLASQRGDLPTPLIKKN